jgi:uncharacterized protein (DUF2237 family)
MAKRVCAKSLDLSTTRDSKDDLRPTPNGDRFAVVAARLREKERTALLPQSAPVLKVIVKKLTAGDRIWNDTFTASLGRLRSNPECAV